MKSFSWLPIKQKIALSFIVVPGGLYVLFFFILAILGYGTEKIPDGVRGQFIHWVIVVDKPISVILLPSVIIGVIILFAGDKSKSKKALSEKSNTVETKT